MGTYYFSVDYVNKLQMWSPSNYKDKQPGVYYPGHPLPCMIIMKNIQGFHFEIVNDISTYEEHEYKDITECVFKELQDEFPDYQWISKEVLK